MLIQYLKNKLKKNKVEHVIKKGCDYPLIPFSIKMQLGIPLNKTEEKFFNFVDKEVNKNDR